MVSQHNDYKIEEKEKGEAQNNNKMVEKRMTLRRDMTRNRRIKKLGGNYNGNNDKRGTEE